MSAWIGEEKLEKFLGQNEKGRPVLPDVGIVYVITCGGRYYIGQKRAWSMRTLKALKGTKRKRKRYTLNYESYTGSSRELNEAIERGEQYTRRILYVGHSKSELSYVETYLQMRFHCTHDNLSYNQEVNIKGSRFKMREGWMDDLQQARESMIDVWNALDAGR